MQIRKADFVFLDPNANGVDRKHFLNRVNIECTLALMRNLSCRENWGHVSVSGFNGPHSGRVVQCSSAHRLLNRIGLNMAIAKKIIKSVVLRLV